MQTYALDTAGTLIAQYGVGTMLIGGVTVSAITKPFINTSRLPSPFSPPFLLPCILPSLPPSYLPSNLPSYLFLLTCCFLLSNHPLLCNAWYCTVRRASDVTGNSAVPAHTAHPARQASDRAVGGGGGGDSATAAPAGVIRAGRRAGTNRCQCCCQCCCQCSVWT